MDSSVTRLIDDTISSFDSPSSTSTGGDNDFKGDVMRLMSMLLKVRDVVADTHKVQITREDVRILQVQLLKNLKEFVHDIMYLLHVYQNIYPTRDFISNTIPSKMRSRRDMGSASSSEITSSTSTITDISDTSRYKRLRERIDVLENEGENLRLRQKQMVNSAIATVETRSPYYNYIAIASESDVYDREDDKEKVIRLLLSDECPSNSSNISFISITGRAGVGKTTLAHIVYKDPRICEYFNLRAWVSVSESFDVAKLIQAITGSITTDNCYEKEPDSLVNTLRMTRKDKTFLLVLDDVHNGDQTLWDTLLPPLLGGRKVKIIITGWDQSLAAQSKGFVQIIRRAPIYHLNGISSSSCWLLFRSHAFEAQEPVAHSTLVDIGKKIVEKCEGLPLSVKMLGSLLRYERDEEKWMNVLHGMEKYITAALRISYDHMPSHLKPCFAYCSLFPKGYKFKKDDLVRSWIILGLIQPSGSKTLENTASECFDNLHRRSFFHRCLKVENEPTDVFGMHDLIHELAQSVSGEVRRATADGNFFSRKHVEHSVNLQQTGADLPQASSQVCLPGL